MHKFISRWCQNTSCVGGAAGIGYRKAPSVRRNGRRFAPAMLMGVHISRLLRSRPTRVKEERQKAKKPALISYRRARHQRHVYIKSSIPATSGVEISPAICLGVAPLLKCLRPPMMRRRRCRFRGKTEIGDIVADNMIMAVGWFLRLTLVTSRHGKHGSLARRLKASSDLLVGAPFAIIVEPPFSCKCATTPVLFADANYSLANLFSWHQGEKSSSRQ